MGRTRVRARALIVGLVATAALIGGLPSAGAASWLDPRCRHGRAVCIDKSNDTLRWVVDGRTRLSMSARFGSRWALTREGTFFIYWKDADHWSNLFPEAMPFSMFFSGGQAIHYSSDFARHGYDHFSHGCVNTRDYAATHALYRATRVGDRVVIYRS